jgi:hypothetical protein
VGGSRPAGTTDVLIALMGSDTVLPWDHLSTHVGDTAHPYAAMAPDRGLMAADRCEGYG